MSNKPLISVIMPAYNVQRYIGESIESVLAQTYQTWELIIVDDGSTDDTATVVNKYLPTNERIKYFYQSNGKQSKARNTAIKNSTGEYLAFLDADDLWLPEKLAISIDEIQSGNYDLLFTNTYYFEDGSSEIYIKKGQVTSATYQGKTGTLAFLESNKIPNLTVVVKKQTVLNAGDFVEIHVAEEYEMWLRLLGNGAIFRSIDTPLSSHRLRKGSLTDGDRLATFEAMLIIKSFAQTHLEFKDAVKKILKDKFKYWLYKSADAGNKKCRAVVTWVGPYLLTAPLYLLSFVLPFKYFRKLSNRTLLSR